MRDKAGDLLYAHAETQSYADSMQAEENAILQAAKHCRQTQFDKVIFQMDSLLIQKILIGSWKSPWSIASIITKIQQQLQDKQVIYQYIYKEKNKLADYLANLL